MNSLQFFKYQGTGNDFVMIDNRAAHFPDKGSVGEDKVRNLIMKLCHRKFGIGADGLILIQDHPAVDFEMVYFNADGSQSMCGNGSRCAVRFASDLGIIEDKTTFMTIDGKHEAHLEEKLVHLKMNKVNQVKFLENDFFINTGSPHHIRFAKDVQHINVYEEGRKIRYNEMYHAAGTNVNFAEVINEKEIFVRTYERGVEDETLSCGTGVTAVALASSYKKMSSPVTVKTLGGTLKVSYDTARENVFDNIYLIGPAQKVFKGVINPGDL